MKDDELPPGFEEIFREFGAKPKDAKGKLELQLLAGDQARQPQALGTVIRGFLHAGSLTLVYGPPKSGKSFLVTDAFISVAACDPDWMGFKIVRPGPVLYVACEGHAGFWKRLEAIAVRRGLFRFPDAFVLARGRPHLIQVDAKSHTVMPRPDAIVQAIRAMPKPPVAVAIDTVFRAIGSGNVNNSDHINAFLAATAAIMDMGIAVVAIHHEIKSGGSPAGSVSLLGGADTIVRTQNEAPHHTWEIESAKDDAMTKPRAFKLDVVDLGQDPDGEPASSCVVVPLNVTVSPQAERARDPWRKKHLRALKKALMNILADQGKDIRPYAAEGSMVRAVDAEAVRLEFVRDYPSLEPAARRQAWKRAVDDGKADDLIGSRLIDGCIYLWLVPHEKRDNQA